MKLLFILFALLSFAACTSKSSRMPANSHEFEPKLEILSLKVIRELPAATIIFGDCSIVVPQFNGRGQENRYPLKPGSVINGFSHFNFKEDGKYIEGFYATAIFKDSDFDSEIRVKCESAENITKETFEKAFADYLQIEFK